MRLISVVTGCYNEEENVEEVYLQVKKVFAELEDYNYEHIFIDNCSQDKTVEKLKEIAEADKNIKIIVNTRNFGHIRSPYYGLLQSTGEATISLVADLQDPPQIISDFIKQWEKGFKIVVGVKTRSSENFVIKSIRRIFYRFIKKMSEEGL